MMKRLSSRISPVLTCLIYGAVFCVAVFFIILVSVAPRQHDLAVGDVAPETITANKEIVDNISYQRSVNDAMAKVVKQRIEDENVVETALAALRDTMDRAEAVRAEFDELFSNVRGHDDFLAYTETYLSNAGMIESLRERIDLPLDDQTVKDLVRSTSRDLTSLRTALSNAVVNAYADGVMEETLAISKTGALQAVRRSIGSDNKLLPVAETAIDQTLIPNITYDEARYEADRKTAHDSVDPSNYLILKSQAIVRGGDRVTEAQHQLLLELGYLREHVDITIYIGLAAVILLLGVVLALFIAFFEPDMLQKPSMTLLLCSICLLHVGMTAVAAQLNAYLAPLQLGVLLIAILIKPRLAMVVNFVLAVLTGILAGGRDGMFSTTTSFILIVGLIGGCQAIYLTRRPLQRAGLFLVGIATGLIDMAVLLALNLMTTANTGDIFSSAFWSAGGGLLSGILAISLMPIFESTFHLLTPPKLLELSNPHQPLLKRLLLEAPGTYHHAIMVANLAEAAIDRVEGNPLLARVSAYYHDVGKLKRPYYFGENQLGGENPHDRMEPLVSAATLIAHTQDGAALAEAARLPQPIVDVIRQHHGTSLTQYFYAKAVEREGKDQVDESDYRYEGPKPQTKEAAVVMLADIVEAGVRSLKSRSSTEIDAFVRKLIKRKLEDGQLDNAPLTLRDLENIAQAFHRVLVGMYHERVAYPDIEVVKHAQRT